MLECTQTEGGRGGGGGIFQNILQLLQRKETVIFISFLPPLTWDESAAEKKRAQFSFIFFLEMFSFEEGLQAQELT